MSDTPYAIGITVDAEPVVAMLVAASETNARTIGQLVETAAINVQREMRIEAPIAVTGQLRGSVRYTYSPLTLSAVIEPTVEYAADVEGGTQPHWVSAAPGSSLAKWANQKGLEPYAVRAIIASRGTKPHPFVAPTYDKMKPVVEDNIAEGITAMVEEINSGV